MIDIYDDEKGNVQSIQMCIGASDPDQLLSFALVHPTYKIVLLVVMNEVHSSNRGAIVIVIWRDLRLSGI